MRRRSIAKATTVRVGRKEIFARTELFAESDQGEKSLAIEATVTTRRVRWTWRVRIRCAVASSNTRHVGEPRNLFSRLSTSISLPAR
jgi:hypothetical protein